MNGWLAAGLGLMLGLAALLIGWTIIRLWGSSDPAEAIAEDHES